VKASEDAFASGVTAPDELSARLQRAVEQRQAQGLLRQPVIRDEPLKATGCRNLSTNDYLRLSCHPQVKAAAAQAIEIWGTAATASPQVSGYTGAHAALSKALSEAYCQTSVLLWQSGFVANLSVLGHLPQKGDVILADRLCHHSLLAGALGSGARLVRFPHNDLEALENRLKEQQHRCGVTFVVTESVYSMDGDRAPLQELADLRRNYGFCWILDEAHALGCDGPTGLGMAEALGVLGKVDVLVGTLGKAWASHGAFTRFLEKACAAYLQNLSGARIYSTFTPPAAAAAAQAALRLSRSMAQERAALVAASRQLRSALTGLGLQTLGEDSAIVPVLLGDNQKTLAVASKLAAMGWQVGAIRPPTVPDGTSRLRVSLHCGLSNEGVQGFCDALECALKETQADGPRS
jgi:8-amino-7-oxononanoate synthase